MSGSPLISLYREADPLAARGQALLASLRGLPWGSTPGDPRLAALVAPEGDLSDPEFILDALGASKLLAAVGLKLVGLCAPGGDLRRMASAVKAGVLVAHPGISVEHGLAQVAGRRRVIQPLRRPLGMGATESWLRTVAPAAPDAGGLDGWIDAQREELGRYLRHARRQLGRTSAVVAAPPEVAGAWVALCGELDLRVSRVGLLSAGPDAPAQYRTAAAEAEGPEPEVLADEGRAETWLEALAVGPEALALAPAGAALGSALPRVLLACPGIPSGRLFPLPSLGFGGFLACTERLLQAATQRVIDGHR